MDVMNFDSKERRESEMCEGVAFTIRTLSQRRRAQWGLSVAEHLAEQDRLVREMSSFTGEKGAIAEGHEIDWQDRYFRYQAIENAYIKPSLMSAALMSIEGVTVDGAEADIDAVLEVAPAELTDEIYRACKAAAGISEADSKNSPSPGTLAGQGDGEIEDSTAQNANG